MATFGIYLVLALAVCGIMMTPGTAQVIEPLPEYTTVDNCTDICPRHRDTVCKLDCLVVTAEGYSDCINHFYYADGTPEYHCWE